MLERIPGKFGKHATTAPPATALPNTNVDASLKSAANLLILWASVTSANITADRVELYNVAGAAKVFTSVSETVVITASGADGLDTGSEAASTWYYVWLIAKEDGTIASLLSVSATAPTMPTDYVYKGRMGTIRNDGSSNFIGFIQRGIRASQRQIRALADGNATTFTVVDLSAIVPPTAKLVRSQPGIADSTAAAASFGYVAPAGSGTTPTYTEAFVQSANISATKPSFGEVATLLSTAQQMVYYVGSSNWRMNIDVNGWDY